MGSSLFNTTPQNTYPSLLKFSDNLPLSSTLKALSDGAGNDTMLQLSTTALQIGGSTGMYWDNTNKRLGVGTNAPTLPVDILGGVSNGGLKVRAGNTTSQNILDIANNGGTQGFYYRAGDNVLQYYGYDFSIESQSSSGNILLNTGTASGEVRLNGASGGRLSVKGKGSTSATTSLLVQNSSGTELLKVTDDGSATISSRVITSIVQLSYINTFNNTYSVLQTNPSTGNAKFYQFVSVGTTADPVASAALEVVSTTKGFLPPRLSTTQKLAIASPASGLQVYDSTLNQMSYYNGTTWVNF